MSKTWIVNKLGHLAAVVTIALAVYWSVSAVEWAGNVFRLLLVVWLLFNAGIVIILLVVAIVESIDEVVIIQNKKGAEWIRKFVTPRLPARMWSGLVLFGYFVAVVALAAAGHLGWSFLYLVTIGMALLGRAGMRAVGRKALAEFDEEAGEDTEG